MLLAVIHYHFDQGGVTQVVKNHLRSLAALEGDNPVSRVLLLHGGRAAGLNGAAGTTAAGVPVQAVAVEGLDYDNSSAVSAELPGRLRQTLAEHGLRRDADVLHVHNHSLGKNVSLTSAVGVLAAEGWRMLLQIHDFAEDFRPANYRRLLEACGPAAAAAYPVAPQIQYAALNGRDARAMEAAGIKAAVLPNPVSPPPLAEDAAAARRRVGGHCGLAAGEKLLVYPVRGIRRKNLGETALWAAALQGRARILQTLSPANPQEASGYRAWQRLAAELRLPLQLGAGACGFPDVISASDAMLTTSVAEGFGMVFLEPWLAGRPLAGRNLPEITDDFAAVGLQFGGLYRRLPVPWSWVGKDRFRRDLREAFARAVETLEDVVDPRAAERQLEQLASADEADFAMLAPPCQAEVVRRVAADPAGLPDRESMLAAVEADCGAVVSANAKAVARRYSPRELGRQLATLYHQLLLRTAGPVTPAPAPHSLQQRFLRLKRLQPARLSWPSWDDLPAASGRTAPNAIRGDDRRQRWIERIRHGAAPLDPLPTDIAPRLAPLRGVRAVLFDIYGTLLISGSGDVGAAGSDGRDEAILQALRRCGARCTGPPEGADKRLRETIQAHQQRRRDAGVDYPEVDICEVWRELAGRWRVDGWLQGELAEIEDVAIEHELRANPVWPMPGAAATLETLAAGGLLLGVVSNAQFYTPLLFPALLRRSLQQLGVPERRQHFSYRSGRAKPGDWLYRQAAAAVGSDGVSPDEVLFVGNDMLNDIAAAASVGMRTALFAGDRRSLRLRRDDPRADTPADLVITELGQLAGCLAPLEEPRP